MIHFLSYLKKKRKKVYAYIHPEIWMNYNVLLKHARCSNFWKFLWWHWVFLFEKKLKIKSMVKNIGSFFQNVVIIHWMPQFFKNKILIFGPFTGSHCYIGTYIRNKSISFKIVKFITLAGMTLQLLSIFKVFLRKFVELFKEGDAT